MSGLHDRWLFPGPLPGRHVDHLSGLASTAGRPHALQRLPGHREPTRTSERPARGLGLRMVLSALFPANTLAMARAGMGIGEPPVAPAAARHTPRSVISLLLAHLSSVLARALPPE